MISAVVGSSHVPPELIHGHGIVGLLGVLVVLQDEEANQGLASVVESQSTHYS